MEKIQKNFDDWAERLETACMISGRDIREAAITLSSGAATKVIKSMNKTEPWSVIKAELRRCFSENKPRYIQQYCSKFLDLKGTMRTLGATFMCTLKLIEKLQG